MDNDFIVRAEDKRINWYPGHMARAKKKLMEQLSRVDVVVELCDARIPRASRNPELGDLVKNKKRLLILNKADLAEEAQTRTWLAYYRAQGMDCMSFDSAKGRAKDVIARIERAASEAVARMAARGVKKTVRVMIVGVPNVGKSTFTNKVNGASIARTGDRPGVTRSNQWVRITPYLELLDTPGLLWPRLDDQNDAQALAFVGTINDQIMDQQMLAIRLLERLMEIKPSAAMQRFKIKDGTLRGVALLEEACRGRGWLLPGGVMDTDRGAAVVLDEFRAGRLGRLTLQSAPAKRPEAPEKPAQEKPEQEGQGEP
ncbi:MAG: ribosome biogenesis GTPase YlqF [Christensenellales bacterium]|nr:ribosome biogenesis GTPase YlqF [Christensenellales bacterium]